MGTSIRKGGGASPCFLLRIWPKLDYDGSLPQSWPLSKDLCRSVNRSIPPIRTFHHFIQHPWRLLLPKGPTQRHIYSCGSLDSRHHRPNYNEVDVLRDSRCTRPSVPTHDLCVCSFHDFAVGVASSSSKPP